MGMNREFVRTPTFENSWKQMGLDEEDMLRLEETLIADPQAGDVIQGLSGARKIRVQASGHGKRGGGRVIYVDIVIDECIYLLLAYPKNELENLTPTQKKNLNAVIQAIKEE